MRRNQFSLVLEFLPCNCVGGLASEGSQCGGGLAAGRMAGREDGDSEEQADISLARPQSLHLERDNKGKVVGFHRFIS